ncbi:HVO_0476 family zinc finger protein [Methanothermococcus sp.]|uniref:HVO_0476 family zinc finger protein n=1 Tax=Methanothermococcus sp. TaxID=2614238 RepID=UPI0025EC204B|nr:HVO_0476 family zinc finger protein [Methanothermococcus sp.]
MDEELLFECPICDDITPHDILKRQESKKHIKLTVKCLNCGYVHDVEKNIKLKDVKVIISRYGESEKKVSQLPVDEVLKVGDIINIFGEDVEITSIETTKRVMSSKVEDIQTIWAKSLNIPKKVGISINDRDTTYSINILVPQDYVFDNETTYRVGRMFFKIKMIKTEKGTFKREIARKIKRIYANSSRPVRNYEDLTENIV